MHLVGWLEATVVVTRIEIACQGRGRHSLCSYALTGFRETCCMSLLQKLDNLFLDIIIKKSVNRSFIVSDYEAHLCVFKLIFSLLSKYKHVKLYGK
jgi:hypothetical protein